MQCVDGSIAQVGDIVVRSAGGFYITNLYGIVVKHLSKTNRWRIKYVKVNESEICHNSRHIVSWFETPTKEIIDDRGILLDNTGTHKEKGCFNKWDGQPVRCLDDGLR
jgi:hypothetical protein